MIPSPSPVVTEFFGAVPAPWWGVPGVAGVFLLAGAVLGFVFNRANDKRRAARELQDSLNRETLDLAVEFLALSNRFTKLGQRSMSVPMETFLPQLVDQTSTMIEEHGVLFTKFRLVMPSSLDPLVRKYAASTVALVIPPFDPDSMRMRLDYQSESQGKFINALRELRGLADLKAPIYEGAQARVEAFADRATAELAKHITDSGIEIVDNPEDNSPEGL